MLREYGRGNQNRQFRETSNIDEEKQSKDTTQYVLNTTMHKQQITEINHESFYK